MLFTQKVYEKYPDISHFFLFLIVLLCDVLCGTLNSFVVVRVFDFKQI